MPKIRQKINRKKDCFLEYKIIDFNIILRDNPYMFNNKKESRNMTQQTKKDWFDTHVEVMTLNDDKVKEKQIKESLKNKLTNQLTEEKRRPISKNWKSQLTEEPNISYKKAVNNLKSKMRLK